ERIILSGGEATLERELVEYVRLARRHARHVRVQTNATRLDRPLLGELIAAGLDEVFVSLHGATPETCDAITQRRGSFEQITAGLAAADRAGMTVLVNIVMCTLNLTELAAIIDVARAHAPRLAGIELWNIWPRVGAEL